jgi:adenylyltransferase/sulfurtransferase
LGPVVNVIASFEAMEAIKILNGNLETTNHQLMIFEMWHNRVRQFDTTKLHEAGTCLTCVKHEFRWLDGKCSSASTVLCGRNSVQISAPAGGKVSFPQYG